MTVFVCPKCGYRLEQPNMVKACSHVCSQNRGRLVVLKKERAA